MRPSLQLDSRGALLSALLAAFVLASLQAARGLTLDSIGTDFLCFWHGGRVAIEAPDRLYDFQHLTAVQRLASHDGGLRPYINPPSALLLFAPLSRLPLWAGYGVLMLASVTVMLAAARRAGAPWWLVLLPPVAIMISCGQVSLLIAGLVLLGLTFHERPIIAGLLFAFAGALKPQLLTLLPLALMAQGRWSVMLASGLAGALILAVSVALFGPRLWMDWLAALPRFHAMIQGEPAFLDASITPYAKLTALGWNGAWAFLITPLVAWGVWSAFRKDLPWTDQLIALLGGALLISPYAMKYELALLAPAVGAYLARRADARWPAYAVAATGYALNLSAGAISLFAVLMLPLLAMGPLRNPVRSRGYALQKAAELPV